MRPFGTTTRLCQFRPCEDRVHYKIAEIEETTCRLWQRQTIIAENLRVFFTEPNRIRKPFIGSALCQIFTDGFQHITSLWAHLTASTFTHRCIPGNFFEMVFTDLHPRTAERTLDDDLH